MSLVRAEVRKLLTLPTARVGLVLGVVLAPLVVLINGPATRRAIAAGTDSADIGLQELAIGLIGAMILGV
ncbi:hypothetical protein AB0M20_42755, partial [Actinoplanes sp. NPDC051633]|uniref:hypothetical protein n=1 Tax=Actinoplanes sp. NPDC051633 TaxID=3155670 RepID=UPI00342857D8